MARIARTSACIASPSPVARCSSAFSSRSATRSACARSWASSASRARRNASSNAAASYCACTRSTRGCACARGASSISATATRSDAARTPRLRRCVCDSAATDPSDAARAHSAAVAASTAIAAGRREVRLAASRGRAVAIVVTHDALRHAGAADAHRRAVRDRGARAPAGAAVRGVAVERGLAAIVGAAVAVAETRRARVDGAAARRAGRGRAREYAGEAATPAIRDVRGRVEAAIAAHRRGRGAGVDAAAATGGVDAAHGRRALADGGAAAARRRAAQIRLAARGGEPVAVRTARRARLHAARPLGAREPPRDVSAARLAGPAARARREQALAAVGGRRVAVSEERVACVEGARARRAATRPARGRADRPAAPAVERVARRVDAAGPAGRGRRGLAGCDAGAFPAPRIEPAEGRRAAARDTACAAVRSRVEGDFAAVALDAVAVREPGATRAEATDAGLAADDGVGKFAAHATAAAVVGRVRRAASRSHRSHRRCSQPASRRSCPHPRRRPCRRRCSRRGGRRPRLHSRRARPCSGSRRTRAPRSAR